MRGKEHTAAVTLQRSMLPGELPSVPGLTIDLRLAAEAPPDVLGAPARLLRYLLDNMLAGQEQDDDVTLLVMSRP